MYILCLPLLITNLVWVRDRICHRTRAETSDRDNPLVKKPSLVYFLEIQLLPLLSLLWIVLLKTTTAADIFWSPLATQPRLPTVDMVTRHVWPVLPQDDGICCGCRHPGQDDRSLASQPADYWDVAYLEMSKSALFFTFMEGTKKEGSVTLQLSCRAVSSICVCTAHVQTCHWLCVNKYTSVDC